MPPAGLGQVKRMILSCDREAAAKAITKLMTSSNGSVRNEILSLARKLDLDM
jgi:phosphotransferase system enzyme I (PtsP)